MKKKPTKKATKKVAKKAATKKPAAKKAAPTVYKLTVGDRAPSFELPATSGRSISLKGLAGKKAVIYFYPKDNTPGCTIEGHDFRRLYAKFKSAGCEVLGVSRDSMKSHEGFKDKCGFPFELIADEKGELCKAFDVIQMKSLYGRKFEGIERSTFVIDGEGRVRAAWRKVKVAGHADEVLESVKALD